MVGVTLVATLVMAVVLLAVPHIIWLIGWLAGLCWGAHLPYAPFGWTGAGIAGVFIAVMLYGIYVGRFRLEVNEQELCSNDVPQAANGYKIVHISDLHLSTFNDRPAALERVVNQINALNPDLICFTGDLVSMGADEISPFTDILRNLHAKDGVCSVLGNHDFLIYRRDLGSDAVRMQEVERLVSLERDTLGWHVLRNESLSLLDSALCIVGVDNCSCHGQGFHTIHAGNLEEAMQGTAGMRILLSHDPSHWRAEVVGQQPVELTLSGHTHAGQVRLFGWPLSSVSFRDNQGWYFEGNQALYINRGIGCTLPMRLNCPQEITLITLKH